MCPAITEHVPARYISHVICRSHESIFHTDVTKRKESSPVLVPIQSRSVSAVSWDSRLLYPPALHYQNIFTFGLLLRANFKMWRSLFSFVFLVEAEDQLCLDICLSTRFHRSAGFPGRCMLHILETILLCPNFHVVLQELSNKISHAFSCKDEGCPRSSASSGWKDQPD